MSVKDLQMIFQYHFRVNIEKILQWKKILREKTKTKLKEIKQVTPLRSAINILQHNFPSDFK